MFKIFSLAIAVSVIPVSQNFAPVDLGLTNHAETPPYIFSFKNTSTTYPRPDDLFGRAFEPEKKATEAWSPNWMAAAQENIRQSEYHFKWEEKQNAYCTPNRKNNLRFFYTDKGFTVEPRTTKIPIGDPIAIGFDPTKLPDEIKCKLIPDWKIKFNLDKKQISNGKWQIVNNKAEYITKNITVQYINNDEGMRQNFIVDAPISKTNLLNLNLGIKTKLKTKLNCNRLQFFHKKTNVLNYEDLKVWDATGKTLNASFKKSGIGKFSIQVNTKDAVYPITIDPISSTPAAIVESNQVNADFGYSVASAGDVNGDGYSDVIAGAYLYDNVQASEGAVFIYHGSANGISTTPARIVESNITSAFLGYTVATAGDVNGDGYSDIIAGAYGYNNGHSGEGAFYVYHGSPTGIPGSPAVIIESNQVNAFLGISVASAGDVNGDGYSDVIAGAYAYDNGETDEGAAFVYHGSGTGISITAAAIVESNQPSAFLGRSVASAGDVNGDGYSDVMAGAVYYDNGQTNEGAVFVYHGSATGISTTAAVFVESDVTNAEMGWSEASAGDVNGDGYSDIIVGVERYNNGQPDEGAAFVYHGSATGISTSAAATVESNQASARMGTTVASAGDVNGDGFSDVMVGAYFYDNGQADEGGVWVYQGSAGGINTSVSTFLENNQAGSNMGIVSAAGDVNGDGYSDVITGAPNYDNGETDEGAAFVYHGSAAGISLTPNNTPDDADQAGANFGVSVASAGDVNGDGYGDVIIGAWRFDDGFADEGVAFVYHGSASGLSATPNTILDDADQAGAFFGETVAGAGDVNGDGYSDVMIGADNFDDGFSNEGRAFVYHGSAAGLSSSPDWIGDDANQANAYFGVSLAAAGDVNGDGYGDVIIGAIGIIDGGNNNEGRAYVYHGSATGLSAVPNSTPDDADQANANFGWSVSGAGDVNGDGFSDVIIGALFYDDGFTDEGRAFVYHGSATGLSAVPNSTPGDADQAGAQFGESVACAGDVNGDGYSDVIIGARLFDDGNINEGRAFVYHGGATGISAVPNSTPDDADQAFASFGISVNTAGDVNGDGYSDVIIGAHFFDDGFVDVGRAFVYHGGPAGLNATPNSIPDDANQATAYFGYSVASAGDINGDGYSDVIIGAYGYDDGLVDEGGSFVYNGNDSTTNKRNNLRLYNTNLTTPLNNTNFIFGNFGAGLYAKSFLGRAKGKLVWETRLNFDPYSGTPITNSTFFTSQQSSYTDLGLSGTEIKNLVNKIWYGGRYTKIRARVKYDPVTALTGQVYGPWRNVSSIIDANNLGALPIELISFNAAWLQKGKTARLDFKTDKESGVCCFDIEKSADGFNFYSIGTLPAKNITGIQSYSFIDANATGKKQFYRIKIKGMAGQTDYSNIQQLSNDKATEILVFPNPTTDVLQLQLNNAYDKMNVRVFNSSGQLVKQMQAPASNQIITIPVQHLPAGKYWLHLQSGVEKQVLQFVKQ